MSTDDELQELNRRDEEMRNVSSVCIPLDIVYEIVMERIRKWTQNQPIKDSEAIRRGARSNREGVAADGDNIRSVRR